MESISLILLSGRKVLKTFWNIKTFKRIRKVKGTAKAINEAVFYIYLWWNLTYLKVFFYLNGYFFYV